MIYTCTLNTAIDMFVQMENFVTDKVNRSIYDELQPNGKGVNISVVLNRLNTPSTATGFIGGFTGKFVNDELLKLGIKTDFIEVSGDTRINVFLNSNQGEYKIVNKGPVISQGKKEELLKKLNNLTTEDTLFVSGSLPMGLDSEILKNIAEISFKNKFRLVLDTSNPILRSLMKYQPFLIKPNEEELQKLFPGLSISNENEILSAAESLLHEGCENILVSLGSKGAYFINKTEKYYCTAPNGILVNTAGAGDTMLATFYDSYTKTQNFKTSLKKSVASGSSTAFTTGLSNFADIEELMEQINVTEISTTN